MKNFQGLVYISCSKHVVICGNLYFLYLFVFKISMKWRALEFRFLKYSQCILGYVCNCLHKCIYLQDLLQRFKNYSTLLLLQFFRKMCIFFAQPCFTKRCVCVKFVKLEMCARQCRIFRINFCSIEAKKGGWGRFSVRRRRNSGIVGKAGEEY